MNDDLDLSTFIKELDYNCSKVQKKVFKKGELITSYIAKRNQLSNIKKKDYLITFDEKYSEIYTFFANHHK